MKLHRTAAATLLLAATLGRVAAASATPDSALAPVPADVTSEAAADTAPVGDGSLAAPVLSTDGGTGRLDADAPSEVSVRISQQRFRVAESAEVAVLARDDAFADALAGSALTATGPILFTATGSLAPAVRDELSRVLPAGATVYLLGGPAALSDAIAADVADLGYATVRLAGGTRVETAVAIASEVQQVVGEPLRGAYLARGWGNGTDPTSAWVDAIAIGPRAARYRQPVLVTHSEGLDAPVARWVAAAAAASPGFEVTLLGGDAALSPAVEQAVPAATHRIAGAARADTAAQLAVSLSTGDVSPGYLGGTPPAAYLVVNGRHHAGWAHGLAAAGLGAAEDGAIVLVDPDDVPAATRRVLHACERPAYGAVVLVGTSSTITPGVTATIEGLRAGDCSLLPLRGLPEHHRFLRTNADGTPVRFNPCAPIAYVVNTRLAPTTGLEDVHETFRRVAAVTGMTFAFAGTTTEEPTRQRPLYQPERYGDRWAPILVTWSTAAQTDVLDGSEAGRGGFISLDGVAVSGQVTLDAGLALDPGFGAGDNWGELLLHEVGHAVGLDHVSEPGQIMSAGGEHWTQPGLSRYENGDREGLRHLGLVSGCLTTPAPRPISYA